MKKSSKSLPKSKPSLSRFLLNVGRTGIRNLPLYFRYKYASDKYEKEVGYKENLGSLARSIDVAPFWCPNSEFYYRLLYEKGFLEKVNFNHDDLQRIIFETEQEYMHCLSVAKTNLEISPSMNDGELFNKLMSNTRVKQDNHLCYFDAKESDLYFYIDSEVYRINLAYDFKSDNDLLPESFRVYRGIDAKGVIHICISDYVGFEYVGCLKMIYVSLDKMNYSIMGHAGMHHFGVASENEKTLFKRKMMFC